MKTAKSEHVVGTDDVAGFLQQVTRNQFVDQRRICPAIPQGLDGRLRAAAVDHIDVRHHRCDLLAVSVIHYQRNAQSRQVGGRLDIDRAIGIDDRDDAVGQVRFGEQEKLFTLRSEPGGRDSVDTAGPGGFEHLIPVIHANRT